MTTDSIAGDLAFFIYASMTIDAFAIVSTLRQSCVKYIADLGTLAKTNPISAITFSITMFSYAGIPPLAGFCSKFYLFFAALGCEAYFLAPVGAVTSVIAPSAKAKEVRQVQVKLTIAFWQAISTKKHSSVTTIISVPMPHCWKGSASKPYVELPPHTAPLGM
ncbi:hypothetical protein L1987_29588 [Smallanthus sonchifolius]|uniref:Uncharacterized protein n=1 Tax=Smallanthus sonchifolius TaxID=185202 RepID=A0ACB9I1M5_9ASTR|nr:hypothetical protein L1987_29588 [Smallanthus sonchifolius]